MPNSTIRPTASIDAYHEDQRRQREYESTIELSPDPTICFGRLVSSKTSTFHLRFSRSNYILNTVKRIFKLVGTKPNTSKRRIQKLKKTDGSASEDLS